MTVSFLPEWQEPRCSICAIANRRVLRFDLIVPRRQPNGRKTSRGCGSIHLCEACWREATAQSRARRRRAA